MMNDGWKRGAIAALGSLLLVITLPALAQSPATEPAPKDGHGHAALASVWRPATAAQEQEIWGYILNSPLGVAALNQLAIEGFISPVCDRTFYTHAEYETFQTLMRVECPTERGTSIARSYREVRVTFNRFEDNIESFDLERIYPQE